MGRKILVLDDDRTFSMLIEDVLKKNGFEVTVEADGIQGLARARTDAPDLIILDVLMPGMTGYDFLQNLRRIDDRMKVVPVIVMSSRRSMKDFFASWDVAFFMPKPFHPNELLSRVEFALGPDSGKEAAAPASRAETVLMKPLEASKKKALWVGYDEALTQMALRELAARDFEVYASTRDDRALEEAAGCQPDVIFCQYHKIKGILNAPDLHKKLKAREATRNSLFVLLCSQDMEADAVRAFAPVVLTDLGPAMSYSDPHDAYKKLVKFISKPLPFR